MLRRRGVRHHDVDEIVQETAARAISNGVTYTDADDLFRWASVVGGRLAIDLHRRGARLSDDELPDRADVVDVAMAAEHRVLLGVVRNRLPELSTRDQAVLLSGLHEEPAANRRESVRVAVARHRARNRLRLLLDGLAGGALLGWARRDRVWSAPAEAISYAVVPTAACVLITIGAWSGVSTHRVNEPPPSPIAAVQVGLPPATGNEAAEIRPDAMSPITDTDPLPSAPRSPEPPLLQDHYVIIDEPAGRQTRAGTRDGDASDHIWCLTSPSLNGPDTRCFDPPVSLPSTP
jgi:DNA-directed RNA polymerase specialized sigma24 family protein